MADPTPTAVTQNLPSPYLEGALTALGNSLLPLLSSANALPTSTYTGSQFVAGQSDLQNQAAQNAAGLGSLTGANAYQQFMSPYQQNVINTTLGQYDIQAQQGLQPLSAQAISAGAFGGARQGVQNAAYQSQSDLNRAALQAQLEQSGYQNAQQQALSQLQAQQGLGTYQSQLGAQQQTTAQNVLTAQQQAAQAAAFAPYTQYGLVGQQLTGLAGGFPTQVQTYNPVQPISPIQAGLGTLTGLGGLAGKIFG
jgi:Arc/MetJ-type ribon-helix-helix transcriptional regulator